MKGVEIRKAEQLENVSCLIIPGGESTTMAKLAHLHNLVFPLFSFSLFFFLLPQFSCFLSLSSFLLYATLFKWGSPFGVHVPVLSFWLTKPLVCQLPFPFFIFFLCSIIKILLCVSVTIYCIQCPLIQISNLSAIFVSGQKIGGQELIGGLDCTVHRNFFGSQVIILTQV